MKEVSVRGIGKTQASPRGHSEKDESIPVCTDNLKLSMNLPSFNVIRMVDQRTPTGMVELAVSAIEQGG